MHHSLLILAALPLLASPLCAQTTVVNPKGFAASDAPSSSYYPFRPNSRPTYRWLDYMEIHDIDSKVKGKLSGIKWRREGTYTGGSYQSPSPVFWANMTVSLSTAAVTSQNMTTTWASNHGKNLTTVLKTKKVNFKSIPYIPKLPFQPFLFSIPFDSGSQLVHTGGSVAAQIEVSDNNLYDSTTSTYSYLYFDHAYNSTSGVYTHRGRGCYGSDETQFYPFIGYSYTNLDTTKNAHRYYGYSYYGLLGGVGIDLMAASKLPTSVPLPGGCYLHVNLGSVIIATPGSGVRGTAKYTTFYYPPYQGTTRQYAYIPNSPGVAGARVYCQKVGVDPKANSMGLVLSNYTQMNFSNYQVAGLGIARGYGYQSGTNKYYTRSFNYGNVSSFTFQ
jgi:hypothetical protein